MLDIVALSDGCWAGPLSESATIQTEPSGHQFDDSPANAFLVALCDDIEIVLKPKARHYRTAHRLS
jgi:hypothetical protein